MCSTSFKHVRFIILQHHVRAHVIVSRYIECIDNLVMIWLTIYRIKSIDSHDMYQNIFFALKSPHKIPKSSVLLHFYQLTANIIHFDSAKYIAIHIVHWFKVSTIRYISDQYSDTELYPMFPYYFSVIIILLSYPVCPIQLTHSHLCTHMFLAYHPSDWSVWKAYSWII